MQKEKTKSLKQVITTEEFNIKSKREEINDLQKKLTQLRGQQENLQNQTNKMSGEINEYIFLIK